MRSDSAERGAPDLEGPKLSFRGPAIGGRKRMRDGILMTDPLV